MAQRISRAKQAIKASGVPFSLPTGGERAERCARCSTCCTSSSTRATPAAAAPSLQRVDLSGEAIRLTRACTRLLPQDTEVAGLLALMLLTDARRAARTGPSGELIPLDEQDRALWDQAAIAEGMVSLTRDALEGRGGPVPASGGDRGGARRGGARRGHRLAADPARCTAAAADGRQPDGRAEPRDRGGDGRRARARGSSCSRRSTPTAASPATTGSTRCAAHLLERAGDHDGAIARYRAAAERTASTPERDYLCAQAARLRSASS